MVPDVFYRQCKDNICTGTKDLCSCQEHTSFVPCTDCRSSPFILSTHLLSFSAVSHAVSNQPLEGDQKLWGLYRSQAKNTYSTVSSQLHHCPWSSSCMSSLNLARQNASMASSYWGPHASAGTHCDTAEWRGDERENMDEKKGRKLNVHHLALETKVGWQAAMTLNVVVCFPVTATQDVSPSVGHDT